jgi:AmmeMemoRadiSam system protein B
MEKPRLRWIDARLIVHEGAEMVLLRDTEGITDKSLVVSKNGAFLLSLMDGTRTFMDLQVEYMNAFGELIHLEQIQELVDAMDSNLLLMNENFVNHFSEVKEEYDKAKIRKPCLAGRSYPARMHELLTFLDGMLAGPLHANPSEMTIDGELTGILAPHIDYERGKAVYNSTYQYLKELKKRLIILFGTSHSYTEKLWNISVKDFSTPLGTVPCSPELNGLIRENHALKHCINEWPHKGEHSIELQLPILQFLAAGAHFEILPILTGSMHQYIAGEKTLDHKELLAPLEGLHEVLTAYGKPYLVVSGADLAHIGAQFGDRFPLDPATLTRSKDRDQAILRHVRDVDADGFFSEIKAESDERRICGLTSIYIQLCLLRGSRCKLVDYGQWTDGESSVSFAGGVFYTHPSR